jgi:hypothetical protein
MDGVRCCPPVIVRCMLRWTMVPKAVKLSRRVPDGSLPMMKRGDSAMQCETLEVVRMSRCCAATLRLWITHHKCLSVAYRPSIRKLSTKH